MVSARINLDSFFDPNEKRIRVAFIKFCGMATGGTEKVLQTIAANLDKNKFLVDFYYCDSTVMEHFEIQWLIQIKKQS